MRYILNMGVVISAALMMSACSTTPSRNHLDAKARPLIQDMDSVLIATQDELEADINVSKISTYAQGHFAPILLDLGINMFRTHKANQLMKPIKATMVESDYKDDIKAELDFALQDSNLEGMGELELVRYEELGFRSRYIRESDADAVMFVDVKCKFTPKFDQLRVLSSVMIFPVDPALSPYKERPDTDGILEFEDNIYRNQFAAYIPLKEAVDETRKKSENGEIWAEMSETQLSGLMKIAARKMADVIAEDLRFDEDTGRDFKKTSDSIVEIQEEELPSEVIPEIDLPDWATGETSPPATESEVVSEPAPDSVLESESET